MLYNLLLDPPVVTSTSIPTELIIGNQYANITGVELNDNVTGDNSVELSPNTTKEVYCWGYVFDIDGYHDIYNAWGTIYNQDVSGITYDSADDNRWHYENDTCQLTEDYGLADTNAILNCTFHVWYYANYSDWNCTITVNDTIFQATNGTDNATFEQLIAVDVLNDSIDWGTRSVDTDYDADLDVLIENEGNVRLDVELDAYNDTFSGTGSNRSFDCQIGYIPVDMMVYNLSSGGIYSESTQFDNLSTVTATEFNLLQQDGTSTDVPTNKSVYLGINIPALPTINGSCTGFLRVTGINNEP